MNYKLILLAIMMVIVGIIALYRNWELPGRENDKIFLMTKKQIRNHGFVGGYSSIIIGIIILSYVIFS